METLTQTYAIDNNNNIMLKKKNTRKKFVNK